MSSITSLSSNSSAQTDRAQFLHNLFQKADADGDGSIGEDELQGMLDKSPRLAKALGGLVKSSDGSSSSATPSAADILKAIDTDGDGKVGEAELTTAMKDARKARHAGGAGGPPPPKQGGFSEVLKKVFSDGDSDGDGSLTSDDLGTMMQKIPGLARDLKSLVSTDDGSTASTDDIFKALDSDGDGKVGESEFTSALKQAHDQIMAQTGAGGPAAADGSKSGSTPDVKTLLMEMMKQLRQQPTGYAEDGSTTTGGSSASSTFNVLA